MTRAESILLIDDSYLILEQLKNVLTGDGFQVTTATSLGAALKSLISADLVIIDYHMPGTDGGEVLKALRQLQTTRKQACLFYLYTSDPEIARLYRSLGFDGGFLKKGEPLALL